MKYSPDFPREAIPTPLKTINKGNRQLASGDIDFNFPFP
jgi:hypothetical protein